MKIKVGFSKSRKKFAIIAWLIMLCERTKFSHTYMKFPTKWGFDLVYHAVGSGVDFCGPEAFEGHHQAVEEYELEISVEAKDRILEWCARNAGIPYSRAQVCGMLIKRMARLIGIKMHNPFAQDTAYVCTELVAKLLEIAGNPAPENLEDMGLIETREMILELLDNKSV